MRYFFSIGLLVIIIIISSSCAPSEKGVQEIGIDFEKEIYNFGKVEEGTKISYSFRVKNNGTELLEITEVRPTCHCTVSGEWDKKIEPGKWGEIPVVFDTTGLTGDIVRTVNIVTNVPGKENLVLKLEGNIFTEIEVSPKNLSFGQIEIDSGKQSGKVRIKNNGDKPMKVLGIENNNPNVEAEYKTIEEGKIYEVSIVVNPPFEKGYRNYKVLLKTDREVMSGIPLNFSYNLKPATEVIPQYIPLTEAQLNGGLEQYVTIQNNTDKPININKVEFIGADIEYRIEKQDSVNFIRIILSLDDSIKSGQNIRMRVEVDTINGIEEHNITISVNK